MNASVIGRLLEEISWEGANVRAYRDGGRGRENVLTAEVLLPLSYLPRNEYFAEVLRAAHGADEARVRVASEIEDAEVTLLPDEILLAGGIKVQPDAHVVTPGTFTLVEAKRIRASKFQTEQLTREYLALLAEAGPRVPLLLVIAGGPPPYLVDGHGRLELLEAIMLRLVALVERTGAHKADIDTLAARIPDVVAWVTWNEISEVVAAKRKTMPARGAGLAGTERRLCDAVTTAIEWHV